MRILPISLLLLCLALAACSSIRDGVIVKKRCRGGMANPYATYLSFRYEEPTVYWVAVQGRDDKGRERIKNIILFRHDWNQLRVGDHWSRQHGFSPAEADK